ncbi:MAG: nitroreductase family protein [Candidatus Aureabacteria bacterium]|nr:nitroreductase family protein [Candidatus Auribacterota bacterium]
MKILEVIRQRYSVRAYQDRPIDEDKLQRVLEAARSAPSAKNRQEWRFIVVTDPELKKGLAEAANQQHFIASASVVIVCCSVGGDYTMRCGQRAAPIDLAIAIDHMSLQAVAEGLGSCWIGAFYPDKVRKLLQIPDSVEIVELLPIGYPSDKAPSSKNRLPFQSVFSYNEWPENFT